jgi:hypothetical protein
VNLKLHKPEPLTAAQAKAGVRTIAVKVGGRVLTGSVISAGSQHATVTVYDAWAVLGHPAYLTFTLTWAEVAGLASAEEPVALEEVR